MFHHHYGSQPNQGPHAGSCRAANSPCRSKRRVDINMVLGATWLLVLTHVRLSSLVMRSNGVSSSQGRPLLGRMLVS